MGISKNIHTKNKVCQFCTFWISGRLFGVDILDVKEINDEIEFTKIFHAPEAVKGYMNIRGQIHLVIDLRLLLGFEAKEIDTNNRVLIFKNEVAEPFGILVDKIGDVIEVEESAIEERRNKGDKTMDERRIINEELTCGVCKLDNMLLIALEAGNILKVL